MNDKFATLTALVKEARIADKIAFDKSEAARVAWKSANETLTERRKVLDGYIAQMVNELTAPGDAQ